MSSNKLVFTLCALSLFLIAASTPLKTSTAAEMVYLSKAIAKTETIYLSRAVAKTESKEPVSGIRLIAPEGIAAPASGPRQSGGKRGMALQPAAGTKIATTAEKITVVGVAEGGAEIEVVNNGQPAVTPVFHDQYFHARVALSLGENKMEVRWRRGGAGGPASGGWNVKAISVFRYLQAEGAPGGDYSQYLFHTSEKEKQCKQCHRMRLTHEEIDTGTDKTCMACHADLLAASTCTARSTSACASHATTPRACPTDTALIRTTTSFVTHATMTGKRRTRSISLCTARWERGCARSAMIPTVRPSNISSSRLRTSYA